MSVTITINGELKLDQTSGLQVEDDDVAVGIGGLGELTGSLDSQFLSYLNSLGLSDDQKAFAADVEGASEPELVSVDATAGETIGKLFFSDGSGNDLEGALVPDVTTLDGSPLYLWSASNGKIVLVSTSSDTFPTADSIVAAFYIEGNLDNSTAKVESITFESLLHPLGGAEHDDTVDFSDVLQVSAVISTPIGDDIQVDDDGPTIVTSGDEPILTVDETDFDGDDTDDFSGAFDSDFGTDGAGTTGGITYELNTAGGPSGLTATIANEAVILSKVGDTIQGRTETSNELVFEVSVDADGNVKLDQSLAVRHDPDGGTDDETTLTSDDLVTLTATIEDADTDTASDVLNIGQNLVFVDDAPTAPDVTVTSTVVEDETAGTNPDADPNPADDTDDAAVVALFANVPGDTISVAKSAEPLVTLENGSFGNDGEADDDSVTYALSVEDGTPSAVSTTGGTQIFLYNGTGLLEGLIIGRVGIENGDDPDEADPDGAVAFALAVDDEGFGYIAHKLSVTNPIAGNDDDAFDDVIALAGDSVKIVVTYTDGDGDEATTEPTDVGAAFTFQDDGPEITTPVDANPDEPGVQDTLVLDNKADPITGTGAFGYNVGSDELNYLAGDSDFVDADPDADGIQLALSGTVGTAAISDALVELDTEDADSALFNFSFTYDNNPILPGVQGSSATGTLLFDKDDETYTVTLDGPIEGFNFSLLHTSELLSKEPVSNVGHPPIVVSRLAADDPDTSVDEDFYVQFTANNTPLSFTNNGEGSSGDTAYTFGAHELASSNAETWVSATQSTNGVAGDTIQKDELLSLRFFNSNVGIASEATDPTATAGGIAIKFDGIGASEDLILFVDLIDKDGADNDLGTADDNTEITRAITVDNGDIFKNDAAVPGPYDTEFDLDQNDGLVIIESNDYNLFGEDYEIQGIQIMQSKNGLTGSGINLNGLTGDAGGSGIDTDEEGEEGFGETDTFNFQAFNAASFGNDNDVLKITDIGFLQTNVGTQDASLDFEFAINDGDNDTTITQNILVNVVNDIL